MPGTVGRVMSIVTTLVVALLCAGGSAQARLITIGFENDPNGFYFNGYKSADSADVVFSSTHTISSNVKDYLSVDHFGQASRGKGLAISRGNPALGAGLVMDFIKPTDFLSLEFGNDDPDQTFTGLKEVVLTLFFGGSQVGQSVVKPNGNGIMDQSISYSGLLFDQARFFFIDDFDFPALVNPIVDNVSYQNHNGGPGYDNVPAPGNLLLLGLGLFGLAAWRKSRR